MKKTILLLASIICLVSCSKNNEGYNVDLGQEISIETIKGMVASQKDFDDDEMLKSLSSGVILLDTAYIKRDGEWVNYMKFIGLGSIHPPIVYDGETFKYLYYEGSFDDGSFWMEFLAYTGIKYYIEKKCVYDREKNSFIDVANNSVLMEILYYKDDKFIILHNSGEVLSYSNSENKNIDEAMADRLTYEEVVKLFIEAGYDESDVRKHY